MLSSSETVKPPQAWATVSSRRLVFLYVGYLLRDLTFVQAPEEILGL